MKALIIYPLDSAPTTVTAIAGDRVAAMLEGEGFTVFRLDTFKANRGLYSLQQLVNPADFIAYFGHGADDRLFGQLPMGIVSPMADLLNAGLFRNSIVYTIACLSARELGESKNARAYLGSYSYMFIAFNDVDNPYMENYIDTWMRIPQVIARGGTAWEAYQSYLEAGRRYVELYRGHPEWMSAEVYARNLEENLDYYRMIGDPEARLK